MKEGTLSLWEKRGWLLDEVLLNGPGEIINVASKPHYIGEEKEKGYIGDSQQLIASRYAMGMKLGRPLNRSELLRFKGDNKQDLRLSNLILHSRQATSAELFKCNGAVLGYSHCLCECGTELDIAKQKKHPHVYAEGHRPKSKNDPVNLKRARPSLQKVFHETMEKISLDSVFKTSIALPKEQPVSDDSLKEFRTLFEKMIHSLPWEEFKELLRLLLEIQTRGKGKE